MNRYIQQHVGMSEFRSRYERLSTAQKVPKGVPAYTLYVNRPIGRMIAAASPPWVTPNGLTLTGTLFSYSALVLVWLLPVDRPVMSLVGLLLIIAFFVDSADGQLARLRGGGSSFGGWLDHVLDAGRSAFLHMTVAAYFYRTGLTLEKLAVCTLFLISVVLIYTGGLLIENVQTRKQSDSVRAGDVLARSLLLLPVDFGILCALFLFLPWPAMFTAGYAVLAVFNVIYGVLYMRKWTKELRPGR